MAFETILVSTDGAIATVTLNRPPLNLVTRQLLEELHAALDALGGDDSVRVVILTGAGERAFSAGADIGEEALFDSEEGLRFRILGRDLVAKIESLPKPVVAAIDGYCMGGGTGLAWPCDIRIASERASFGARDPYLGLVPSWSVGMVRLSRWIGKNRAMEVLLLGEFIDAAKAKELGLVTRVVPAERLMDETMEVARRLAGAAPMAVASIKQAVVRSCYGSIDEAAAFEEEACRRIFESEDAREGMRAFKEKREPRFTGR